MHGKGAGGLGTTGRSTFPAPPQECGELAKDLSPPPTGNFATLGGRTPTLSSPRAFLQWYIINLLYIPFTIGFLLYAGAPPPPVLNSHERTRAPQRSPYPRPERASVGNPARC